MSETSGVRGGSATITRRAIWVGAGAAAAAARLTRRAYRARHRSARDGQRLTVQATVAPELVADLADLLRRVTGRAADDQTGAITVSLAPGVSASDVERELRTVVHRWSEMHPGVRVRISAGEEAARPPRRWKSRRAVRADEPIAVMSDGMLAPPPQSG